VPVRQWPPGSERKRLSELKPGTEVLRGAKWYKLERWTHERISGLYLVWWEGQRVPDTFKDQEPVLTVWLLTCPR
jgi:hypothetical protein